MDAAEILRRFERQPDGTWTCRVAVTVETAHGPVSVEPGQVFHFGDHLDDVDLAELLERIGAQHGS